MVTGLITNIIFNYETLLTRSTLIFTLALLAFTCAIYKRNQIHKLTQWFTNRGASFWGGVEFCAR